MVIGQSVAKTLHLEQGIGLMEWKTQCGTVFGLVQVAALAVELFPRRSPGLRKAGYRGKAPRYRNVGIP
ncbi:MAG: hypothetical protein COA70_03805 [Planctomycetota bacterium]|nr:MAG: hypothetical protein COA70_03805 [Planctomycetota bacterium]